MVLVSHAIVEFYLSFDGPVDMQIWALLTRSQCWVSDTQVTVTACGPLVKFRRDPFANSFFGHWFCLSIMSLNMRFTLVHFHWILLLANPCLVRKVATQTNLSLPCSAVPTWEFKRYHKLLYSVAISSYCGIVSIIRSATLVLAKKTLLWFVLQCLISVFWDNRIYGLLAITMNCWFIGNQKCFPFSNIPVKMRKIDWLDGVLRRIGNISAI